MKKASKPRKKSTSPKKQKKADAIVWTADFLPNIEELRGQFIELKQGVIYENTYEVELTFRDDK